MLHLLLGAAIAAPLVALVVPLYAISRLSSGIVTSDATVAIRRKKRSGNSAVDLEREWAAHEFAFAHAIKDYEELIDETAGGQP
jgi:hypothetical protein